MIRDEAVVREPTLEIARACKMARAASDQGEGDSACGGAAKLDGALLKVAVYELDGPLLVAQPLEEAAAVKQLVIHQGPRRPIIYPKKPVMQQTSHTNTSIA